MKTFKKTLLTNEFNEEQDLLQLHRLQKLILYYLSGKRKVGFPACLRRVRVTGENYYIYMLIGCTVTGLIIHHHERPTYIVK